MVQNCQNVTNPSGSSHEEQLVAKRLMLYILLWFGNVLWHFWVSAARPSPQLRSVTKLSNSQFLTISSNLCSTIIIHLSNSIYRQKEFVHEGGQGGDNDWITFKEITMVCYSSWGQLTSELGIFEHWQFTNMEIQKPFIHRQTYSMTGMELSHGRAWARDWLRAKFPKLAKDFFQLSSKIKVSAQADEYSELIGAVTCIWANGKCLT